MCPIRAGEGPLAITKQLSLGEILGNRGAVDRDQFSRTLAPKVDGLGHALFARAGFSLDDDRDLGQRGVAQGLKFRPQGGPRPVPRNHFLERLGFIGLPSFRANHQTQPLANADQTPDLQNPFEGANPVDVNPVPAAEIADQKHQPFATDLGVTPRHLVALQNDVALSRAANDRDSVQEHGQPSLQVRKDPANGHDHLALGTSVGTRARNGSGSTGSHGCS